jgi:hypothetical protein
MSQQPPPPSPDGAAEQQPGNNPASGSTTPDRRGGRVVPLDGGHVVGVLCAALGRPARRDLELDPRSSPHCRDCAVDCVPPLDAGNGGVDQLVGHLDPCGPSCVVRRRLDSGVDTAPSQQGQAAVTGVAAARAAEDRPVTAWTLEYDAYDPAEEGQREALCTLGNGFCAPPGATPESRADWAHQCDRTDQNDCQRAACFIRFILDLLGRDRGSSAPTAGPLNWPRLFACE